MPADLINVILAFLEGLALILSPCILPILPLVLSGSLTGNKSRPLGIIAGFIITFSVFTLFSRYLISYAHIDLDVLRYISFFILLLFGLIMISTTLSERFSRLTNGLMNIGNSLQLSQKETGFWSGFLFGGLIGFIWTPCAGPILASVIVQAVVQRTTLTSALVVIAFAVGAGLPMLLIALLGRRILDKLRFFRSHTVVLRKLLGYIIIASVFFLFFFPTYLTTLSVMPNLTNIHENKLINGLKTPMPAPEIAGISEWINSPPLTISSLKGKVVLIDFWTYSCINCIRTLPYLKDWYTKYQKLGLVIIGVHTPEFEFEKNSENVKHAVADFHIDYPVALDNQYQTWQNFNNHYWPAHYLIDKDGMVVYTHFGEGEYDVTENNIRFLLGLNKSSGSKANPENFNYNQTPETYLGYARGKSVNLNYPIKDKLASYTTALEPGLHEWSLEGNWYVYADKVVSGETNAKLHLHFFAKKIFVVMGSNTQNPVKVDILLDGRKVNEIPVTSSKLYPVASFLTAKEGQITLVAKSPGLQVYTFTFGA